MRIEFIRPQNRGDSPPPKNALAEAEVYFDSMTYSDGCAHPSPFAGLKLVAFTVWAGDRGIYVTFPGRAFGAGTDRQFFDYLRAGDAPKSKEALDRLYRFKRWMIEAYKEWDAATKAKEAR